MPKGGKLSVKQTLDALLMTITGLHERIIKLEKQSHFQSEFISVLMQEREQYLPLHSAETYPNTHINNNNNYNNNNDNNSHNMNNNIANILNNMNNMNNMENIQSSNEFHLVPIKQEPIQNDSYQEQQQQQNNINIQQHSQQQQQQQQPSSNPLSPLLKSEFMGDHIDMDSFIKTISLSLNNGEANNNFSDINAFFASSQENNS